MSRCTPGHGWTSRKRRLGGGEKRIPAIRTEQEKLLQGRAMVLGIERRRALDDVLRPVDERANLVNRLERNLELVDACKHWLADNPVRVLSRATLIATGIIEENPS